MKSGLEFFPLDCQLDDKLELIEAEFGVTGFAVIVKLWQKIYASDGYYCEWTKEVALLFGRRNGLSGNVVSEIVSSALKRGIFSKELYDKYSILTSNGIQKRYLEATSRRKKVLVKKEYLLVTDTQNYKNVDISSKNVNISKENVNKKEQSRVKESKVKQSKVDVGKPTKINKPPTYEDVKQYALQRNSPVDPKAFFEFYDVNSWVDSKGNKVKSWKQKFLTWEKSQNNFSNSNNSNRTDTLPNTSFSMNDINKLISK